MKNDELIKMKWDIPLLNKLIGLAYKSTHSITIAHLRNLQRLLNSSDLSMYQNKATVIKRIDFLKRTLDARIDKKFEDEGIIINYCRTDIDDPVINDIINNLPKYKQLNFREIQYLNNMVEDRLMYGTVLLPHLKKTTELEEKLSNGEYDTFADAVRDYDSICNSYKTATRSIKTAYNNSMMCFNDPMIGDRVQDSLNQLGNTSDILITGIQMLNELLSPGLRPEKLYIFLGGSGGFKSAMLLKLVIDCQRYNSKSYRAKKEGHIPVVLYLTMENTIPESIARLFNMTISSEDIEKYTSSQVVKKFNEAGIFGNNDMEIIFMYKPNKSITTADIRDIIDSLDDQGKEVCLLVHDYIARIHSAAPYNTEKEEYNNVTNELRQIAIDYMIPVVTAHQTNRVALSVINAASRDEKQDLARLLGNENVGNAIEIVQNADMIILLNLERRKIDNRLFLTFKRSKSRYKPATNLSYFNQPFREDNEFMLVDDIFDAKPAGCVSLSTDMDGVDGDTLFSNRGRKHHMNNIKKIDMPKTSDLFDLQPIGA